MGSVPEKYHCLTCGRELKVLHDVCAQIFDLECAACETWLKIDFADHVISARFRVRGIMVSIRPTKYLTQEILNPVQFLTESIQSIVRHEEVEDLLAPSKS